MGKPSAPEAPDISGLVAATEKQADLSYQIAQDQLDWAKEQYASDKETIDKVVESTLRTQDFTQASAEEDRARYEEVFQPLEDQFVQQVQEYASPARTAFEVGRAQADVAQQFDQAREASQQQLESYGLNPADTRYQAMDVGTRTQQAAASAAAGTQAATNVENTQLGLLGEAINIGHGYPGQVSQSYATSLGAGQGAAGATNAATQTASGAMTNPVQYIGAGNQGYGVSGQTQTSLYNSQVNAYNASLAASSGWGSALGSLAGLAGLGIMQLDEGGAVPESKSPSGGAIPDDVPARLSAGEFVIPEDVVRHMGTEYWYKQINKSREKQQQMASAIPTHSPRSSAAKPTLRSRPPSHKRGYAEGGLVSQGAPPSAPGANGLIVPGNIDLNNRPMVDNGDGSYSTVNSISFNDGQYEVLIPTVSDDGQMMSDQEAIQNYRQTGKHLGKFNSVDAADAYAEQLHQEQAQVYDARRAMPPQTGAIPMTASPAQ